MLKTMGTWCCAIIAIASMAGVAHADSPAEARAAFNRDVRGDESGHAIADGSPLANASKACGTQLDASVDFAGMPPAWSGSTAACGAVVDAFVQLCSQHGYGPAVKKVVHKIECRYDGKHDPEPDQARLIAGLAKDMELKNGTFIYHMRQSHSNVADGVAAALDRDLRAFKDLQAAALLPYQVAARRADAISLYGDEEGKTIREGSLLDRFKGRCGFALDVTVDYVALSPDDNLVAAGCGGVLEALSTVCKADAFKSTIGKLHKLECRRDGKHLVSNNNNVDVNDKQVSLDMEIQGSTLIYHAHPSHANLPEALRLMLARKK
jgi:hypothetical protein